LSGAQKMYEDSDDDSTSSASVPWVTPHEDQEETRELRCHNDDDDDDDAEEEGRRRSKRGPNPERYGTMGAATLLVADCVGTGVLALPNDAKVMGLGLFAGFMALNLFLNIYAGSLVNKAASREGRPRDLLELATRLGGSDRFQGAIRLAWYANLLLVLGNYVLVMAQGIDLLVGGAGSETTTTRQQKIIGCAPVSSLLAAGFCLLLVQGNRTMHALDKGPSQVSLVSVAVIVVLCLSRVSNEGKKRSDNAMSSSSFLNGGGTLRWLRPGAGASARALGASFGSVVFAVNSQKLLLNVRAEMIDVTRSDAALTLALCSYVFIYVVVVLAAGPDPPEFLLDVFQRQKDSSSSVAARFAGLFLFGHVAVSYAINQQAFAATVLARIYGPTKTTRTRWLAATATLTAISWAIANAVPFFDDLVSLIGALTSTPLSFAIPAALYQLAVRRHRHTKATGLVSRHHSYRLLLLFSIAVLVVGTAGAIASIVNHWKHVKRPFHC